MRIVEFFVLFKSTLQLLWMDVWNYTNERKEAFRVCKQIRGYIYIKGINLGINICPF